jgi:predicted nucleic acid-binding protein
VTDRVFLDSGIFIALLSSRDQWHDRARALFGGHRPAWGTSYLVVSETYSWFLHRHGEEAARSFRAFVSNLDGLTLFEVDEKHDHQIGRMLDRLRGAKLTYVDASSLCFMERLKIRKVWSTDHHLGLTGAEVLPRS